MAVQQLSRGQAGARGLTVARITTVVGLIATRTERAYRATFEPERLCKSVQMTGDTDAAGGPLKPGDGMVHVRGPAVLGIRIQPC